VRGLTETDPELLFHDRSDRDDGRAHPMDSISGMPSSMVGVRRACQSDGSVTLIIIVMFPLQLYRCAEEV
jgi:hypothetical protein